MTGTAKKISLDFRRVKNIAAIADATLGIVASQPSAGVMQDKVEELKREINKTKAFLNDRDYKAEMVEKAETVEKLQKQAEALEDSLEEAGKKFTLRGLFGKRSDIAEKEKELKEISAELDEAKAEHHKMRDAQDAARDRLEKMDALLCKLEGRPPKSKPKGFKL